MQTRLLVVRTLSAVSGCVPCLLFFVLVFLLLPVFRPPENCDGPLVGSRGDRRRSDPWRRRLALLCEPALAAAPPPELLWEAFCCGFGLRRGVAGDHERGLRAAGEETTDRGSARRVVLSRAGVAVPDGSVALRAGRRGRS